MTDWLGVFYLFEKEDISEIRSHILCECQLAENFTWPSHNHIFISFYLSTLSYQCLSLVIRGQLGFGSSVRHFVILTKSGKEYLKFYTESHVVCEPNVITKLQIFSTWLSSTQDIIYQNITLGLGILINILSYLSKVNLTTFLADWKTFLCW